MPYSSYVFFSEIIFFSILQEFDPQIGCSPVEVNREYMNSLPQKNYTEVFFVYHYSIYSQQNMEGINFYLSKFINRYSREDVKVLHWGCHLREEKKLNSC
jgi:hypothetical protein